MENINNSDEERFTLAGDFEESEDLPATITPAAMRESCFQWLEECSPGVEAPFFQLGDGRVTLPTEASLLRAHEGFWSIPVRDSDYCVNVVLRQWAEDPPDRKLAESLTDSQAWQEVVWRAQVGFEQIRSRKLQLAWEMNPLRSRLWDLLRGHLTAHGFPATPGTARFLLYQLVDEDSFHNGTDQRANHRSTALDGDAAERGVGEHWEGSERRWFTSPVIGPTRGVRIISFGLTPMTVSLVEGPSPFYTPEHGDFVSQTVSNLWSTATLRTRASSITTKHLQWWQRVSKSLLPRNDNRQFNGKPRSQLRHLGRQHLEGGMTRTELYSRAYDLREATSDTDQAKCRHLVNQMLTEIRQEKKELEEWARQLPGRTG